MVDTTDSKSVGFGHASSSLAAPIGETHNNSLIHYFFYISVLLLL